MTGMQWEVGRIELGDKVLEHMADTFGPRMETDRHIITNAHTGKTVQNVSAHWVPASEYRLPMWAYAELRL